MSLFKETAEDYLELVKDWEDPWPDPIIEIHDGLRDFLCHQLGNTGADIRLLYGGSVKANNAEQILLIPNVNGCLVGGASLKFDEFWDICRSCDNILSA